MEEMEKLKKEIEVLKRQLIKYLDNNADINDILDLNFRIDDLIVKYHRLNMKKDIPHKASNQ